MYPTLYEVHAGSGPIGLHTYGLFILLAFCAAFLLVYHRSKQVGLHPDRLVAVYVSAAVGGLAGGRLLYAIAVEPMRTLRDPLSLVAGSGFALYGGVLGGAVAVGLLAVVQDIPKWKLADIAAPAVLLGIGVGRVGCFFAGCCHGAPAPVHDPRPLLPEGVLGGQLWLSDVFPFLTAEFHGGVGRLLDQPLYPTQLWSAAVGIGLCAALSALWSRRRFDGQIAALALMIEPWFRGAIEVMRADHRGYVVTWEVSDRVAALLPGMASAGTELAGGRIGLTTSQAIGLGMVIAGAAIWVLRRNAGVEPEHAIEDVELEDLSA